MVVIAEDAEEVRNPFLYTGYKVVVPQIFFLEPKT